MYQISKLSTVHGQILRHLKNVWQPYRQPHRHRSPPILWASFHEAKNLASKNSSGHDGISARFIKRMLDTITPSLTHIINQSLSTGIFPDRLKIPKVIPLFKKGDEHILDNYRPISLLKAISKVFEKIVFNQLYQYFTDNDLIFTSQYGFRKLHSTEFASIKLVDRISQYMDCHYLFFLIYRKLSIPWTTQFC